MHITLRPSEKIYINGAVIRVDRKVSLELMNDAVFLLEAHVMLEKNATTPLRRLYFTVQLMLMEPSEVAPKRALFGEQAKAMLESCKDGSILTGLTVAAELIERGRAFEALKVIRSMLPLEDALTPPAEAPAPTAPITTPAVRVASGARASLRARQGAAAPQAVA